MSQKYEKLVLGLCVVGALLSAFIGHLAAGIPGAVVGPLIFVVFIVLSLS